MPPTPELTVTLLEDKLADWCREQNIPRPTVRIKYREERAREISADAVALGSYNPSTQTIELFVKSNRLVTASGQRLLHVTRLLNRTLLHELRHHWQANVWSPEKMERAFEGPYHLQTGERDANDFADAYYTSLTLLRVKRSFGGGTTSGFGRLATAQKGVKA